MEGTIRIFDSEKRMEIHEQIRKIAIGIAESSGAEAEVIIKKYCPVAFNDYNLTQQMVPTLERVSGKEKVIIGPQITGSEDFIFFKKRFPDYISF
jgi:metal-dependent amidase/aminoacylase/carboxypeptidase family protein